jgi:heme/copper-type cytochrome/quinol oxidase subunit 3
VRPVTDTQLALPSAEADSDNMTDTSVTVYGVVALGVAAIVFVGALLGAWLSIRMGTHPWPPKGFKVENYWGTTLSLTMIMSALAGWWIFYGVTRRERGQAAMAATLVLFFDVAFINLLTYVLRSSKIGPASNAYGLLYYALNGAIIAVVGTGLLVAGVTLARVLGGQVTVRDSGLAWAAAWYTTFVTVAWLVVYTATYVIS